MPNMISDSSPIIPRADDGFTCQLKCRFRLMKIEKAPVANMADVSPVRIPCLSGYILFRLQK